MLRLKRRDPHAEWLKQLQNESLHTLASANHDTRTM
jgi:hypothetical protein